MTRDEILRRYRRLRAISVEHHTAALDFVPRQGFLDHARRLGLESVASEEACTLIFDLALYTAPQGRSTAKGRSRALDRYARAAALPPGSDAARMLEAMRLALFSIWRIDRRHELAGLVVTDLFSAEQRWLMDESLEQHATTGMLISSRLSEPAAFSMTSGVVVPTTVDLLDAVKGTRVGPYGGMPSELAQDPRFAASIYRGAIELGIMEGVVFA